MSQCEIVLVYIKDGVFGELEKIRSLVSKSTTTVTTVHHPMLSPEPSNVVKHATSVEQCLNKAETEKTRLYSDIPHSTSAISAFPVDSNITPQNTDDPLIGEHVHPSPTAEGSAQGPSKGIVIPESARGKLPVTPIKLCTESAESSLPSIGMFLSKTCMIPLVRCDFKQIKKNS